MEQSQNNILGLLLQLGAHPQRANSALKILDASTAGLTTIFGRILTGSVQVECSLAAEPVVQSTGIRIE